MSICLVIVVFWGMLFCSSDFRVGLIPIYFKGNAEAISVMLIFFSWFFKKIFYRNQILLCKCFDRKSLAISYNSMNSFGFFKRSKFRENQHPKSVSKGNRCTFLLELLCLDLPRLCPSAPSNFCCSHRWLSTITSLGASLLGACCILQQGQWPGGAQGNERRGCLLRSIISDPCHARNWHLPPVSPFPDSYQGRSYSLLAGCHSSFQPVYTDIPGTNTGTGDPQRQLQILDHLRCFQQAPLVISTVLLLCYQKPTNLKRAGSATWHWTHLTLFCSSGCISYRVLMNIWGMCPFMILRLVK